MASRREERSSINHSTRLNLLIFQYVVAISATVLSPHDVPTFRGYRALLLSDFPFYPRAYLRCSGLILHSSLLDILRSNDITITTATASIDASTIDMQPVSELRAVGI